MRSIAFLSAYLKNQKQKTNIESTFSKCLNKLLDVPQGSTLGRLLFLIFIADLFYLNYHLDFHNAVIPLPTFVDKTLSQQYYQSVRTKCIANSDKSHSLTSPYEKVWMIHNRKLNKK